VATRRLWAWPLLAALLSGAVCSNGDKSRELDQFLCTPAEIGSGYQQLTNGDFSPRDLADLGPNADLREQELRAAGLQRGRFVLFKQALPPPPFDPPINLVCEVLEFDSPAGASNWVAGLTPAESVVRTAVMGWLPPSELDVVDTQRSTPPAGTGDAQARFESVGGSGHEQVFVVLDFRTYGKYVAVSAAGGSFTNRVAGVEDELDRVVSSVAAAQTPSPGPSSQPR
jgi:hypothetical protein